MRFLVKMILYYSCIVRRPVGTFASFRVIVTRDLANFSRITHLGSPIYTAKAATIATRLHQD